MNGELMKKATKLESKTVLGKIVASANLTQVKVQQLFMAALARHPSKEELAKIKQLSYRLRPMNNSSWDIWWALLNSSEFILDH